jgi:DNA-binding NarL/FixJ family response regulator
MNKSIERKGDAKIKVLLLEDHPMFRDQITRVINEEPDMEVCGAADNVSDGFEMVRRLEPDLAIVDISLKGPGGIEFLKDLRAKGIDLPTLVLSMHQESLYAERVLHAGGRGYINKAEPAPELRRAIRQVLAGEVYLSPEMTSGLLKRMAAGAGTPGQMGVEALTDRELEIFQLIGRGQNVSDIAKTLNLGNSTIETYRARIREKLGVKNAAALYSVAANWLKDLGA